MSKLTTWFISLFVAFSTINISYANETKISVTIGGAKYALVAPIGFFDAAEISPDLVAIHAIATQPDKRLITTLVDKTDYELIQKKRNPNLTRYVNVYVKRDSENIIIPQNGFEEIKKSYHEKIGRYLTADEKRITDRTNKIIADAIKSRGATDEQSQFFKVASISKPIIFNETSNSISYFSQVGHSVVKDGNSVRESKIAAMSIILFKGKLLVLSVNSSYTGPQDLDWCIKVTKEWMRQLLGS